MSPFRGGLFGGVIGIVYGLWSHPAVPFLGILNLLKALGSSSPADQSFKQELLVHLGFACFFGVLIGAVGAHLLRRFRETPEEAGLRALNDAPSVRFLKD